MASKPPTSLRALTSRRVLDCLEGVIAGLPEECKGLTVLVVDSFVLTLLDATVGLAAVIDAGFLVVDMFETDKDVREGKRRRPYPELGVVYFFREDEDERSVSLICRDFEDDVRVDNRDIFEKCFPCIFKGIPPAPSEVLVMYKEARVVTVSGIRPTEVHDQLRKHWIDEPQRYDRLRLSLKRDSDIQECSVEYVAWESNLFTLEMFRTLSTVYNGRLQQTEYKTILKRAQEDRERQIIDVAVGVASVCVTLGEFPSIRYSQSGRSKSRTEDIARRVYALLKSWRKANRGYDKENRETPATLLIVDRVDDIAPALMHDLTYGSLIVDMLDHDPCTPYVYTSVDKKGRDKDVEVYLDERDPVYMNLRGLELHQVSDRIDRDVKVRKEATASSNKKEGLDAARAAMQRLINDDALVDSKYLQHVDMAHSIFEAINERNFKNLLNLEQQMLTGITDEGDSFKYKDAVNAIRPMFDSTDPAYLKNKGDQLRILMLLVLTQPKLEPSVLKELVGKSKIGDAGKNMIQNLKNLYVPVDSRKNTIAEGAPEFNKDRAKEDAKEADECDRRVRYVTKVDRAVQQLLEGKLSKDKFPYVNREGKVDDDDEPDDDALDPEDKPAEKKPVAQSARTRAIRRREDAGSTPPAASSTIVATKLARFKKYRGRVIVFVLGGISQMEINALNNLAALTHKEIVIGSTSLLTPRDFVLEVGETEPLEVEEDETPKAKKGDPKASGAQAAADRLDAQRRARASATQKQTAVDDVALDSDDDGPAAKKPSTRGGAGGPSGNRGKPKNGRQTDDIDIDMDSDA